MPQTETPHEDAAASAQRDAGSESRDESNISEKQPGHSGGYMTFGDVRERQKFRLWGATTR